MIIDGKKLAENLELEIKSSLERSDLSNSYLVEFDFDNPNLQSDSLFFEKIIESAVFIKFQKVFLKLIRIYNGSKSYL